MGFNESRFQITTPTEIQKSVGAIYLFTAEYLLADYKFSDKNYTLWKRRFFMVDSDFEPNFAPNTPVGRAQR